MKKEEGHECTNESFGECIRAFVAFFAFLPTGRWVLFFFLPFMLLPCSSSSQISGTVTNYAQDTLHLHKCYKDTLLPAGSVVTDAEGGFSFVITTQDPTGFQNLSGLYRVTLQDGKFFYILFNGNPVKIKTRYLSSPFYNIPTDSLEVLRSPVNKTFYRFQRLQKRLNIANTWLLNMMRKYPRPDPFHKEIKEEYFERHEAMEGFIEDLTGFGNLSGLIARAYYQPVNPDWKQPDPWRDSIIADHYFEHWDPGDPFYLHTNVLPEKMNEYLRLRSNKRGKYGQRPEKGKIHARAAHDFLKEVEGSSKNLRFCLGYFLKKFREEHQDKAFLHIHDKWLKTKGNDCGPNDPEFSWARKRANKLRKVQVGHTAPNFTIEEESMNLHQVEHPYTLVLFWASWCSHCQDVVPEIRATIDSLNEEREEGQEIEVVAVSLDRKEQVWKDFVKDHDLKQWINTSELKGWDGEVPNKYNVHATPTMFLLDEEKEIVAKPRDLEELTGKFETTKDQ